MKSFFSFKELLKGKTSKRSYILIGFLALIVLILILSSDSGKTIEKASFDSTESIPQNNEIERILEELKKEEKNNREDNIMDKRSNLHVSEASLPSRESEDDREFQRELEKFKVEKRKKELLIQRLKLEAEILEAKARIRSARRKLAMIDSENSHDILIYEKKADDKSRILEEQKLSTEILVKVPAGTFIDAVVQNGISVNNGETSPISVFIDRDVPNLYSNNKFYFLKGTRFIGETLAFSQDADRLIFAFHTMILPNGREINIGEEKEFENTTTSGELGNASSVNRHFFSLLFRSLLVGFLEAGSYFAVPYNNFSPIFYPGMFSHPEFTNSNPEMRTFSSQREFAKEYAIRNALYKVTESIRNSLSRGTVRKTTIRLKEGVRIKLFVSKGFSYKI